MAEAPVLHLFEGYGVELEYMIVSREGSAVRPIADRLIERECGRIENEIERDGFAWSNELARHVIELKTNGPVDGLGGVAAGFQREIDRIGTLLAEDDCRLMPGGMHPTMDPTREFALWPHGDREIYESFDRIFDCTGHGWANLQSMHLNLPFAGDDEFGRLHAAVRALLPLLPAIAASSPYRDGVLAGDLDARIRVYAGNARKVPSVSGVVVPDPSSRAATTRRSSSRSTATSPPSTRAASCSTNGSTRGLHCPLRPHGRRDPCARHAGMSPGRPRDRGDGRGDPAHALRSGSAASGTPARARDRRARPDALALRRGRGSRRRRRWGAARGARTVG
ncbi:MAG: glutamate-cysteine ligase family protein [Myxococcota bacterium]